MTPYENYSLALSAAGTAADYASAKGAQDMNLAIARENNEFQEKMFDKQIQYNWDMWYANNLYNDPSNQARRYAAAGINPQLAMEGVSPAQASGGSVSPPQGTPSHVDPFKIGDDLARIGDILYNSEARKLDLQRKVYDNELARLDTVDRDDEVMHNALLRQYIRSKAYNESEITGEERRYRNETHESRVGLAAEELAEKVKGVQFLDAQIQAKVIETKLNEWHLVNAPIQFKAELAEINARIAELASQREFNYASARVQYQQELKLFAETYGLQINNRQADALFDSAVKAGTAQNWAIYRRSRLDAQSDMDTFNYLYGDEHSRTTIGRLFSLGRSGAGSATTPLRVGKVVLGQ